MDSPPSPAHVQELRASLLADTEALEAHLRSSRGQALSLDIALQIRAIITQNRFLISRLGSAYVALLMGKELTQDQIAEIERIAEYIRKNKEPDEKVEKEEEKRVESDSSNSAGVTRDEETKYVEQGKESPEKKEKSFEDVISEEEEEKQEEQQEEEDIEETQDKQERKEEIVEEEREEKKEERTSVVVDIFTSPTPPPSLPVPVPSKTPVFYTSSEPLKTNKIVHFETPLLPSPQENQQQYTLQETHLDENKNNIHIITTRDRLRRNSFIDAEVVNSDKEESSPAIEIDTELNQRASKLSSKEPINNTEESTEITTTTTTENKINEKTTPNIEKKKKERRERKHQHDNNNNTNNNNNRTQRRNITQTRTLYCLSCRLMMQQEEILALRLALGNNREQINILASSTEEALNVIRDPLPKYLDTFRQLKRGVGDALSSVNNLCSTTSSVIPLLEEQSTSPSNAVPEIASRRVAAEDRAVARSIAKTRELLKSLESPPPPPRPQPQLPSSSSSHVTTQQQQNQLPMTLPQTIPSYSYSYPQQQPTAAAVEQSLSTSISVDGDRLPDPRPVREALRQRRERPTYLQRFMRTGSPVGAAQLPGGVVKAPRI